MAWLRLYLSVEGQSERDFAKIVLIPHLANFEVNAMPRLVVSNRKHGVRGGVINYSKLRKDLELTLRSDHAPEARFTTLIDLYRLPQDFPGWERVEGRHDPIERVSILERAMAEDIDDPRFIPHLQLHEFEALLYCDLSQVERRIAGSGKGIERLQAEVARLAPEEIDEGSSTAPSKRLIKHVPLYKNSKVRVGAPAAAAIPLPELRAKCPHFDAWLGQLEALGSLAH